MAALILLILFGLAFASFATQNTGSVHLLLGSYMFNNIPMYVVIIGSILFGVFISWLIHLVEEFTTFFTLQAKEAMLNKSQKTIEELQNKNRELEMALANLPKNTDSSDGQKDEDEEEKEEHTNNKRSLLHHLRQNLGLNLH